MRSTSTRTVADGFAAALAGGGVEEETGLSGGGAGASDFRGSGSGGASAGGVGPLELMGFRPMTPHMDIDQCKAAIHE